MKENETVLLAPVSLAEVTPEILERALKIDQENNDATQKAINSGNSKFLPGNWEAASKLPLKSVHFAKLLAGGVMSSAMHAAEDHTPAPFSVLALRFLSLGFELGVIAYEEAQKKQVN